jgi:serine/threonine-protein kinase HipA
MKFQHKHHTFLSQRFDRTALGRRIHFASAMTMLGYTDGTDANDGASYLEIAEFLMQHGAAPQQDLFELWQRIVFNICVSNTDDHLRNHGFLLTPMGWRLSPAYDINPVPNSYGLKLNINAAENSLDLDLALETASYYRIKPSLAKETIQHIKSQVRTWEVEANALNITRQDLEVCRSAFSVCEK